MTKTRISTKYHPSHGWISGENSLLPIYLIDSSSLRIKAMYEKDWGYVLGYEPQTRRQSLNFYQLHSCLIEQTGGKTKGEKLEYIFNIGMW